MKRPSIQPGVLSALTAAVPRRLIKKLDKKPELAEAWSWLRDDDRTTVTTDKGAVVEIEGDMVSAPAHLRCSCLLAPKCLHRLAVATRLPLSDVEARALEAAEVIAPTAVTAKATTTADDVREPMTSALTQRERDAIRRAIHALCGLLSAGTTSAGAVVQAELFRALHEVRGAGLHRLAALIMTTVRRLRALRDGEAGLQSVLELATTALALCWAIDAGECASEHERGVARRRYVDLEPTLLWGLASTPFRSETGYAGVTTWLADRQGRVCSVSSVRPSSDSGGAELAAFAHASISHAALSRAQVVLHGARVSPDQRIGTGKSVRVAETGASSLFDRPASSFFERPLDMQLEQLWSHAELAPLRRPAGWDLLWLDVVVDAERGVAVVGDRVVQLTELNSTAGSGRRLRMVARWVPDRTRTLQPISLAIEGQDYERWDVGFGVPKDGPELREWFANAPQVETPMGVVPEQAARTPWTSLQRTALQGMSGGWRAFPSHRQAQIQQERSRLHRLGLVRGADLLGALYRTALPSGRSCSGRYQPPSPEPFAAALTACALYLETLRASDHRAGWRK